VKPFFVVCALTVVCSIVLVGQTVSVPAKWIGTWELNVSESTLGKILVPGAPPELAIVGQRLRIEQSGQAIRLSGDTVISDSGGAHSLHEDTALSLDGSETVLGPFSLSFRPIDSSNFEVTSKVNIPGSNVGELSRFSFSPDGGTLTETKTQTKREAVPAGADTAAGAVIKTSKFVLVFSKVPEQ
jgi:hypothetical protein